MFKSETNIMKNYVNIHRNPADEGFRPIEESKVHPIFVSTACLSGLQSIASRVTLYKRHGLDAIELGAGISSNEIIPSQISNMECQFLVHNYFPPPIDPFVLNLASSNSNIRQRSIDFISDAIALTASLNAQFYSVHAGFITDPTSFKNNSFVLPNPSSPNASSCALNRFTSALEVEINYAEHFGVGLLVENNLCTTALRGKLLLQTADEFLELFDKIKSKNLGILLDTGHLNVTAHTFGFDPMSFIDQVAPHIRAFHVHDNDGISDTHQPIQPDSWVLDVLCQPKFADLPIVIEAKFNNVRDLCEHVNWLQIELEKLFTIDN